MGKRFQLEQVVDGSRVFYGEPMSKHTTFRVGGLAEALVCPNASELAPLLSYCRASGVPYCVIGNGSNLLVSDRGVSGVVLELSDALSEISVNGDTVTAEAGVPLPKLAAAACSAGLSGLEFASGIPGTVGGAVVMNAGAYGGEIKDCLAWAEVLDADGSLRRLTAEQLDFSYRHSCILEKGYIVTRAAFSLRTDDVTKIRAVMREYSDRRREKQPLQYPSAGSTFKRPEGNFAGKLIMEAGLRGFCVGGAQISEKHCGFIVNRGGASASDIYALMQEVIRRVRQMSGVTLEPEVKLLGEFDVT